MAQYTMWCPPVVRDDFDDYCNRAPPPTRQRAEDAFDDFHSLLADDYGVKPPISYAPAPPVPANAAEMEVRSQGVRFLISVDFGARHVWLEGITV